MLKYRVRKVLLPWYNSCSFFEQCIHRLRKDGKDFEASAYTNFKTQNQFDRWIRSSYNSLVKFVRKELGDGYRLYTVVPKLVCFVDDFTNWYIRLSRDRMKGFGVSDEERMCALATVYEVRILWSLPFIFFLFVSSRSVLVNSSSYPMGLQRFCCSKRLHPCRTLSMKTVNF